MRKHIYIIGLLLAFFSLIPSNKPQVVNASTNIPTLTVGFYDQLNGFFDEDEMGNKSGYAIEFLEEIEKVANCHFEYYDLNTWEEGKTLIQNKTIDIRIPVEKPDSPNPIYYYPSEEMITSFHVLMCKNGADYYYNDVENFPKLKIGIVSSFYDEYRNTTKLDYLTNFNINASQIREFNDDASMFTALENGNSINAIITNVMDLDISKYKMLARFNIKENYICMLKENPYCSLINTALTTLKLSKPEFANNLYKKYFPERFFEPFTREETNCLKNISSLNIASYQNRIPIIYSENNLLKGIAIDTFNLLNKIEEFKEITFNFQAIDLNKNILDYVNDPNIDILMPLNNYTQYEQDIAISNSLFEANLTLATNGKVDFNKKVKIGVSKDNLVVQNELLASDYNFDIVKYDSILESLTALKNHKIQAVCQNEYVLEYYLQKPIFETLSIVSSIYFRANFCVGSTREDKDALINAINKGIARISANDFENIVKVYTLGGIYKKDFSDILYANKTLILIFFLLFTFLILIFFITNRVRHKYYKQIIAKSQEVLQANEAKSDFFSRMNHDIRTPMNGILGLTNLALLSTSPEEVTDYLQKIKESSNYLLCLVNDALDLTKINQGKIQLEYQDTNLPHFIQSIESILLPSLQEKNIRFNVVSNIEHTDISLDPHRMEQVLINLFNNAIKFSDKNSEITLQIDETSHTNNIGHYSFQVIDHGVGMSSEFTSKAFLPFEQEKNKYSNAYVGTGLGLAIVKNLVDEMQGNITLKSELNKGSTFTITIAFPIVNQKVISEDFNIPSINYSLFCGKEILVAEDNQINALIMQKTLEMKKIKVTIAKNGKEAVEAFCSGKPHQYFAILMDVRMPIMDGLTACREIRLSQKEDSKTIPIIAVSANAMKEDQEASSKAGMNGHLNKPINTDLLFTTLSKFL